MLSQSVPRIELVKLLQPASTQYNVDLGMSPQNYCQPTSAQCDVDPLCLPTELLSTYLSPVWCGPTVSPHRAIVNLPQPSVMLTHCVSPQSYCQPTSAQCDVVPLCLPIELLSTYLSPVWCGPTVSPHRTIVNLPQPSVMQTHCVSPQSYCQPTSAQCDVDPLCLPTELLSTYLSPVWCWPTVSPHRAIVNPPQPSVMWTHCVSPQNYCQPTSAQCDADPLCLPTELLSTYLSPVWCGPTVSPHRTIVNLPQPSVMWTHCVSPQNYCQPSSAQCDADPLCLPTELLSTYLSPVWCGPTVSPHRAIVNLPQPSVMWTHCVSPQSYCQPTSAQCDADPLCLPTELLSTYLSPVWCGPTVSPHRTIVNLPQPSVMLTHCVSPQSYCQPTSAQCDVDPLCLPTELLSTYFNPVWCLPKITSSSLRSHLTWAFLWSNFALMSPAYTASITKSWRNT